MSKINDEDLISLITGNIDQQKSNSLMQIIKEEPCAKQICLVSYFYFIMYDFWELINI